MSAARWCGNRQPRLPWVWWQKETLIPGYTIKLCTAEELVGIRGRILPPMTFGERLSTCQFFDNRPANWAFNLLVAFPLSLVFASALAAAVFIPLRPIFLLFESSDPVEQCKAIPDYQDRMDCFDSL